MLNHFHEKERIIHGTKTAIACIIGLFASSILGENGTSPWILITIVIVMCAQLYVGSVFQKAYLRFFGTLIGTLVAAITILFAGQNNLGFAIAIMIASFSFSYYAVKNENYAYASTLGLATTIIILLSQRPDLTTAGVRCFEISIGILIATLVSQFILPINARTHLKHAQAHTLEHIRCYYKNIMDAATANASPVDYHSLDEVIVKSILRQRQLAKDSKREPFGEKFNPEQFMQLLYTEREMLRAITFMHIALLHNKNLRHTLTHMPELKSFNDRINTAFKNLIELTQSTSVITKKINIPSLKNLKQALASEIQSPPSEEHIQLDGFLFSSEILISNLKNFAKMHKISFEE